MMGSVTYLVPEQFYII